MDEIMITQEIENMLIDWLDVDVFPLDVDELEVRETSTGNTFNIKVSPNG